MSATEDLLTLIEEGLVDKDYVIMACLKWMGSDNVKAMCQANDISLSEEDY